MLVQSWAGLYPDEMQVVVIEGVWTMLNTATQLLVSMPTSGKLRLQKIRSMKAPVRERAAKGAETWRLTRKQRN